ncbi:MAG: carboxypeptidase-like regulatory domain-containing protein, partial [Candidatus Angelobacter sp.]
MTISSRSLAIRGILRSLALLVWMLPLASFLWASGPSDIRTYSINLSVIDEKNQPVPDATVEIRSTGGPISTYTTSATGKVTLTVNGAASYSLRIQKKGYLPTETTLEVAESNPAQDVDVVLSEAALSQQSVEVKGEASSPVTETAGSPATLPTAQAKNSAIRPATLADALPLIPGIVRAKDGSVRIAGLG